MRVSMNRFFSHFDKIISPSPGPNSCIVFHKILHTSTLARPTERQTNRCVFWERHGRFHHTLPIFSLMAPFINFKVRRFSFWKLIQTPPWRLFMGHLATLHVLSGFVFSDKMTAWLQERYSKRTIVNLRSRNDLMHTVCRGCIDSQS